MFCHSVETCYQYTPPFSTFYLVHFSGKLLFNTLAQSHMVGIDDISQEVNALVHWEHTLVGFHLEVDLFQLLVDDITNLSQFRFRVTEYDSVITIAVEMTDTVLVLQIMV